MMENTSSVKGIEEQVKKMAKPLKELIESLEPEIRPTKRIAYSLGNDFNDEFARWADDTPPPWMGEDRLI